MLCEKCHAHEATVHMVKIVNGNRSERHLCSECAEKEHISAPTPALFRHGNNPFFPPGFLDEYFDPFGHFGTEEIEAPEIEMPAEKKNSLYDGIKKSLRGESEPETKPEDKKETLSPEISKLQDKLNECIQNENFEEAARLRDEIKKLAGDEK